MKPVFRFLLLLQLTSSGCAVYYHDPKTGAEHIWGVGHLVSKVNPPADGKQAIVQRATLTGFTVGIDDGAVGFSAGWDQRERITLYDANTSLSLLRPPGDDFLLFKFGALPPSSWAEQPSSAIEKEKSHE